MGLDCELGHPSQGLCVRLQVGHAFCNFLLSCGKFGIVGPSLKPSKMGHLLPSGLLRWTFFVSSEVCGFDGPS